VALTRSGGSPYLNTENLWNSSCAIASGPRTAVEINSRLSGRRNCRPSRQAARRRRRRRWSRLYCPSRGRIASRSGRPPPRRRAHQRQCRYRRHNPALAPVPSRYSPAAAHSTEQIDFHSFKHFARVSDAGRGADIVVLFLEKPNEHGREAVVVVAGALPLPVRDGSASPLLEAAAGARGSNQRCHHSRRRGIVEQEKQTFHRCGIYSRAPTLALIRDQYEAPKSIQ